MRRIWEWKERNFDDWNSNRKRNVKLYFDSFLPESRKIWIWLRNRCLNWRKFWRNFWGNFWKITPFFKYYWIGWKWESRDWEEEEKEIGRKFEERGSGKELKLQKDADGDVVDIDFEQQWKGKWTEFLRTRLLEKKMSLIWWDERDEDGKRGKNENRERERKKEIGGGEKMRIKNRRRDQTWLGSKVDTKSTDFSLSLLFISFFSLSLLYSPSLSLLLILFSIPLQKHEILLEAEEEEKDGRIEWRSHKRREHYIGNEMR